MICLFFDDEPHQCIYKCMYVCMHMCNNNNNNLKPFIDYNIFTLFCWYGCLIMVPCYKFEKKKIGRVCIIYVTRFIKILQAEATVILVACMI